MMLKLVVLVALVAAANGASCPAVCLTCFAGGAGGGTSLVGGVCHASCSTSRYCGTSDAYTNGGTDCTGCAETPTVSQRANLKLADAHFVTNTKASITAAELLYKQTVVEFSALFNAGSLLTKSAKARYNYLLDLDSRKPAAEQAFSTGTATVVADPSNDWKWCVLPSEQRLFDFRDSAVNENACIAACEDNANCVAVARGKHPGAGLMGSWCIGCPVPLSGAHGSRTWAYKKISADTSKTPYAASELSSLLGRRSNDQCSDGKQNGDETGVDCGGSCSVCPVDCVSSETTCTCTPACGNTCDCTDTITITTPAAGRGQACPSATVRTFTGAACAVAYENLGPGTCGSTKMYELELADLGPWNTPNLTPDKCMIKCEAMSGCSAFFVRNVGRCLFVNDAECIFQANAPRTPLVGAGFPIYNLAPYYRAPAPATP